MSKKSKRKDTVLQNEKCCYLCKLYYGQYNYRALEPHHTLNGIGKRNYADELGLWIWLCPYHHRLGKDAVHNDMDIRRKLKEISQAYYEIHIGSRQEFIKLFGKSYL